MREADDWVALQVHVEWMLERIEIGLLTYLPNLSDIVHQRAEQCRIWRSLETLLGQPESQAKLVTVQMKIRRYLPGGIQWLVTAITHISCGDMVLRLRDIQNIAQMRNLQMLELWDLEVGEGKDAISLHMEPICFPALKHLRLGWLKEPVDDSHVEVRELVKHLVVPNLAFFGYFLPNGQIRKRSRILAVLPQHSSSLTTLSVPFRCLENSWSEVGTEHAGRAGGRFGCLTKLEIYLPVGKSRAHMSVLIDWLASGLLPNLATLHLHNYLAEAPDYPNIPYTDVGLQLLEQACERDGIDLTIGLLSRTNLRDWQDPIKCFERYAHLVTNLVFTATRVDTVTSYAGGADPAKRAPDYPCTVWSRLEKMTIEYDIPFGCNGFNETYVPNTGHICNLLSYGHFPVLTQLGIWARDKASSRIVDVLEKKVRAGGFPKLEVVGGFIYDNSAPSWDRIRRKIKLAQSRQALYHTLDSHDIERHGEFEELISC